ncbi:MAG: hypothetical protein ACQEP1_01805 [Nanobdellota archaeon]
MASEKRTIPRWFLLVVGVFIIYGAVSMYFLGRVHGELLYRLNIANIVVTLVWIVFNIFMWYYFVRYDYEIEAVILATYYIIINVLNALNLHFDWITDYGVLRNISVITKTVEALSVMYLLSRR